MVPRAADPATGPGTAAGLCCTAEPHAFVFHPPSAGRRRLTAVSNAVRSAEGPEEPQGPVAGSCRRGGRSPHPHNHKRRFRVRGGQTNCVGGTAGRLPWSDRVGYARDLQAVLMRGALVSLGAVR